MIFTIIIFISIVFNFSFIQSEHFYGGTVTWRPLNGSDIILPISITFTQSYQWKRSYNSSTQCDQSFISSQSPLIPLSSSTLECVTTPSSSCSGYTSISINEYCTDFSTIVDSSAGQISTVKSITSTSKFCVAYRGMDWIGVQLTNCGSGRRRKRQIRKSVTNLMRSGAAASATTCNSSSAIGSIGTCVDLTVRSSSCINSPPVTAIISPIKIPIGTVKSIQIPVIDADNDFLSCRWAQNKSVLDECGDICGSISGSTLDSNNCILTFDSTGKVVGEYYAVALMIEDFNTHSKTTLYSSVPIQFLIQIINTTICSSKPTITSSVSTGENIKVGVSFNFTLTITQGCSGTTIDDVFRVSPLYMSKGEIKQVGSSNVWTVTETWTPTSQQIGGQVYCAMAIDSDGIQSDQYCLTFKVFSTEQDFCSGYNATTTTTTTSSTTSTLSQTTSTSTTASTVTTTTGTTTTSKTSTSTTSTTSTSSTASTVTTTTATTSTSTTSTTSTSTTSTTTTFTTSTSTTSTTSTSTTSTSTTTTSTTTTSTTSTITTATTTTRTTSTSTVSTSTTTTSAESKETVTVTVIVTVPTVDNSQLNILGLALGLGLGLPLLLLLSGLSCYCCCFQLCKSCSSELYHRYFDYNESTDIYIESNEKLKDYATNDKDQVPNDSTDYREQYINANPDSEKNNKSISSVDERPLTQESSLQSTSFSNFELSYMNITRTSLFSPSTNVLPNDNVEYTTKSASSNTNKKTYGSVLIRAYSAQQNQKSPEPS